MKKRLKLLLVDFDGVLSNGRFYDLPDSAQKEIGKMAAGVIFDKKNESATNRWMRGELSYADMHDYVEREAGINARLLDQILEESVKYMPLNPSLLRYISFLRLQGIIVSLFTNNMDIFDTSLRKYHQLDTHFDFIYSSSRYGQLKLDDDRLLRTAMSEAGAVIENTVLVDDSLGSFSRATGYGVETFRYEQYEASQPAFERWLGREYLS